MVVEPHVADQVQLGIDLEVLVVREFLSAHHVPSSGNPGSPGLSTRHQRACSTSLAGGDRGSLPWLLSAFPVAAAALARAGLLSIPSGSAALIRSSSIMSEPFRSGGGLVAVPRQPRHGLATLFISSRGLGPHLAGLSPRETSACWPITCWRLSRRRTPCCRIRQLEAAQSIPVAVACLRAWRTRCTICARPPSCRPAWTGRRSPWARTCRDAGEGGLALEAYELIEYKPSTHSVDVVRVVMIPSPVQQVHLLDLEPGQSVIRAKLERGRRVSVASWVNPDESHADAGFDAYVAGIVEVVETVTEITQTPGSHPATVAVRRTTNGRPSGAENLAHFVAPSKPKV